MICTWVCLIRATASDHRTQKRIITRGRPFPFVCVGRICVDETLLPCFGRKSWHISSAFISLSVFLFTCRHISSLYNYTIYKRIYVTIYLFVIRLYSRSAVGFVFWQYFLRWLVCSARPSVGKKYVHILLFSYFLSRCVSPCILIWFAGWADAHSKWKPTAMALCPPTDDSSSSLVHRRHSRGASTTHAGNSNRFPTATCPTQFRGENSEERNSNSQNIHQKIFLYEWWRNSRTKDNIYLAEQCNIHVSHLHFLIQKFHLNPTNHTVKRNVMKKQNQFQSV